MAFSQDFVNRHAVVIGGAKGIGGACAHELGMRGARITIADIDTISAQEAVTAIRNKGGQAQAIQCDVWKDDAFAKVETAAEAKFGALDVVMNNVGAMIHGAPEDIPLDEWHRLMDLNFFSVLRGVKQFLPAMIARGSGHIVNTASFAGLLPYASSRLPYGAAKAAIVNFSQNLAIYAEPKGVRVTCFIPGPVMTGIQGSMASWGEGAPMRGPGSHFAVMTAAEAAIVLADQMAAGGIMVVSDPSVLADLRRWAASPDAFIRDKIAKHEAGTNGLPTAESIAAVMARAAAEARR